MADKEATVYIVDVGSSMRKKHNERDESDLDWAMHYIWDKITSTASTSNELEEEQNYEHITVLQPISQILMDELRNLHSAIRPSGTDAGDAISALVIAIQMINKYCKKLKYRRTVVLVTNGRGSMDAGGIDEIAKKIKEDDIHLVVLGVDFDDPEFGFKEEDKDPLKVVDASSSSLLAQNEATLRSLAERCDGIFGTLEQAISELGLPRIKAVKPIASYKGPLTLGAEGQDTTMSIDVERYPRTMVAKAPSASAFVVRSDLANGESSAQSSATVVGDGEQRGGVSNANGLTSVKSARTYQVIDDEAPGGKRDVERDDLAKGYEYGRTAVHISESDENVTKLETEPQLSIIGFIPWAKYERYMNMSTSNVIVAQRVNDKAIMALSSLVHALFELESYAVARLVTKENKGPLIVLLAPSIEPAYECLIEVQLPFAEDVRQYKFPPLDRVVTVSGKVLKEHRNLPNNQLTKAMSDYVDEMDLSTVIREEDG
ncbi:MAG: ATP-dependent DNA helicase II subunit 2 [Candelina submexicana]|nr:MAG: ATP-dependent DNA helicase II subunit 2 [Candelina submexicana]